MKRFVIAALLAGIFVAGAAAQENNKDSAAPAGGTQELSAALQEMTAAQLGALTVGDVVRLTARVSVAAQRVQYVQRARMASMMLPGVGQFMMGDPVGGSLFLAGDLALFAGTVLGTYFLLPANVQFGSLDYLNAPIATIKTTWEGNSLLSYLPSMGVMAGGMILQRILGHIAGANAAKDARMNIANGKVTFTPSFGFTGRGFGMGMMMRF